MSAVTLGDIAKKLGLSTSTVSRALSGSGRIGEETRKRVLEAAKEANYTVNAVARSLRLNDAKNMGIVVPDITNSFFASVIKGAQETCRAHGYTLMVCNSDENPVFEEEALWTMLEKQISGIILATVGCGAELIGQYQALRIPVVFIDNIPAGIDVRDVVSIDNYKAAYTVAEAMVGRGYRNIGMISGPESQSTGYLRRAGFLDALRASGLTPRADWILQGDFKMDSGYALTQGLLARPQRPHALVISNNYMAYGALNALREAALSVPGDMAIAAFDAFDSTGLITPLVASINQPAEEIGLRAAQTIVTRLSGEGPQEDAMRIVLQPVFKDGDSW